MPPWYSLHSCSNPVGPQLAQIHTAALAANEPYAAWLALRCTSHPISGTRPDGSTMAPKDHCKHVADAHAAVVISDWLTCIAELEHLGAGGGVAASAGTGSTGSKARRRAASKGRNIPKKIKKPKVAKKRPKKKPKKPGPKPRPARKSPG